MKIVTEDHGYYKGKHQGFTVYDEDEYDGPGGPLGHGNTVKEALQELKGDTGCPYCKDTTAQAQEAKQANDGKWFIQYECTSCHAEFNF